MTRGLKESEKLLAIKGYSYLKKLQKKTIYCEICGQEKAVYTCPKCGRKVCENCYNKEKQACQICSITLCDLCGINHATDKCQICGRQVCPQCSHKIHDVKTICNECLRKHGLQKTLQILQEKILEANNKLAEIIDS